MKFLYKILLWSIIIMAAAFGLSGYFFVNFVFETALDREVDQALDDSNILQFAFETAALNVPTKYNVLRVLTNKEYGLLVLFIRNKNIALFRENLYEKVWGDEYLADSRTLDLHVQRLRRKMGWEDNLVAVYKVGYRLEV